MKQGFGWWKEEDEGNLGEEVEKRRSGRKREKTRRRKWQRREV